MKEENLASLLLFAILLEFDELKDFEETFFKKNESFIATANSNFMQMVLNDVKDMLSV